MRCARATQGNPPYPGCESFHTEQRRATDCLQPTLRSRFRQRLIAYTRLPEAGIITQQFAKETTMQCTTIGLLLILALGMPLTAAHR